MGSKVVHVFSNVPGILSCLRNKQLPVTFKHVAEPPHQGPISQSQLAELKSATILIGDPSLIRENNLCQDMPNLQWLMSSWAGVDGIMKSLDKEKPLPTYTLTRFGGCFGNHMAEYVVCHIVSHERNFNEMKKQQEASNWATEKFKSYRILPQLQIGILGAGDIGIEIAKACKNFGMTVWGITNRPVPSERRHSSVDHYKLLSDLPEVLAHCDYLCCVLPSTPQTRGLLSGDVLSQCKKKPVLINVGRGDLISESSIINALDKQWISHAVLDVVEREPLPSDSPLWKHPAVTITPHVSACSFAWQVADKFAENYQKFVANEKMDFIVNWDHGY